jgi:ubiquinone/menaquinone biosynthesis C-methylase UbiE
MTTTMHDPVEQTPNFEGIFETINAFQRSSAIKAAVELDIFTHIADGANSASELAKRCGATERGIRILCDYLTVLGLLQKDGGAYSSSPDCELFLNKRSPAYVGSTFDFFFSPLQTVGFDDLASAVRGTRTTKGVIAPEHPVWVTFARAMAPLMFMPSQRLAELLTTDSEARQKVLDIAAGHGLYGISYAARNPNAEIVGLDWAPVLEVARENARQAGLAERYRTIAGDAFEVDLEGDYDLVLLVHLLHHFDPESIEKLLRKIRKALKLTGRLAILEFVPNDDRISPRIPAMFSLFMLATTPHGDAYTYAEFDRWLRAAGFTSNQLHSLPPTFFRVITANP